MVSLTSQLSALRRLAVADADRTLLSRRITSGLSIADTADTTNALTRSRAITRTTTQLTSVQTSLDTGIAVVSAASNAVTAASGTLASMRAVLAAAKDPAADLRSLQSQFTALGNTLRAGVAGAAFGGVNLLATGASASFDAAPTDERGRTYAIGADLSRTRLLDPFATSGILQRSFDLSGVTLGGASGLAPSTLGLSGGATATDGQVGTPAPGTNGLGGAASAVVGQAADANRPTTAGLEAGTTSIDGTDSIAPNRLGFDEMTATAGISAKAAGVAKVNIGTYNSSLSSAGDRVRLTVTGKLDGNTFSKTLDIFQRSVTDRASLETELRRAVNAAFTGAQAGKIEARVDNSGAISLSTTASGANQSISVDAVAVEDGDGVRSSDLGLQTQTEFNTTDTIAVDGKTYHRDFIGAPNFADLKSGDTIKLTFDGALKSNLNDIRSKTIEVKTSSLTGSDKLAELVAAINDQLRVGSNTYFRATTQSGQIVVYNTTNNAAVRMSSLVVEDGDGTDPDHLNLGFATNAGTGTAAVSATAASATTGSDFAALTLRNGAELRFELRVAGNSAGTTKTVTITEATVKAALGGSTDTINDLDQFVLVARKALADAGVTGVDVAKFNNRLRFTKTGTAATGDSITVSNVGTVDASATQATLTTGTAFGASRTLTEEQSIDILLRVNGDDKLVSLTRRDVDAALGAGANGTIGSAAQMERVVEAAMGRTGVTGFTVDATNDGRLRFTRTAEGAGSIAIASIAGRSAATSSVATAGAAFAGAVTIETGAEITFGIQLGSDPTRTLRIDRTLVEGVLNGRNTINTIEEFASVAQQAVTDAGLADVVVGTSIDSKLTFTRAADAGTVTLGTVAATGRSATRASLRTGSDFADPVTLETGASIGFDLTLDSRTERVTISRPTVEAALGGRNTIANASEFAQVIMQALDEASVAGISVAVVGNGIELRKTTAGAGRVAIGNVGAVAGSGGSGSTVPGATTLERLNLASSSTQALGQADRIRLIDGYIRNIDAIAQSVAGAGSHLIQVARQLDIQSAHTTRLQTIETARLNSQVRTDMDKETARKTALEARIALARQALGIISESRKNVLVLLTPLS